MGERFLVDYFLVIELQLLLSSSSYLRILQFEGTHFQLKNEIKFVCIIFESNVHFYSNCDVFILLQNSIVLDINITCCHCYELLFRIIDGSILFRLCIGKISNFSIEEKIH